MLVAWIAGSISFLAMAYVILSRHGEFARRNFWGAVREIAWTVVETIHNFEFLMWLYSKLGGEPFPVAGDDSRDLAATQNQDAHSERRAAERLVVGVMSREFERSLGLSCTGLLLALVIVCSRAAFRRDAGMIAAAVLIGALYLMAVLRQAVLVWRTRKGYFGNREHEVKELLAFALKHQTPEDFFDDNGHLLPVFEVAFRESNIGELQRWPLADQV